jgi:diketogulonate reductase-like aldo/keto reductase
MRQVTLNFLTRDPNLFTIPKTGDPDHVRDNSGAAGDWKLSDEDISTIDRTFPLPRAGRPLEMI